MGDWLEYKVEVAEDDVYRFQLRAAVYEHPGSVSLLLNEEALGSMSLPVTGEWQRYVTSDTEVYIPAGEHILSVRFESSGVNLNWLAAELPTPSPTPTPSPCEGPIFPIPIKLEAESYCDMFGVQIEPTSDAGGGDNIGWTDAGDWVDLGRIEVAQTGTYDVTFRVASDPGGGRLQLLLDGEARGVIEVPSTGGWQQWASTTLPVQIAEGIHDVRVLILAGGVNINWVDFRLNDGVTQPSEIAPGTYAIVNEASGRVLDVAGISNANGANVQTWDYSGGGNQHWAVEPLGEGRYILVAEHSGACLDADSGSNNVHQWQCVGNLNQEWRIEAQSDGSFILRVNGGSEVLGQVLGGDNNGANVDTRADDATLAQRWRFLEPSL